MTKLCPDGLAECSKGNGFAAGDEEGLSRCRLGRHQVLGGQNMGVGNIVDIGEVAEIGP